MFPQQRGYGNHTDELVQPSGVSNHARDGYVAIRCPERADYRDGNKLVLREPPRADDIDPLLSTWTEEFAAHPDVDRLLVQWEVRPGVTEFDRERFAGASTARGLSLECGVVLTARDLVAPPACSNIKLRPAAGDDWATVFDFVREGAGSAGEVEFLIWQYGHYRAMAEAGAGQWWGAWAGRELRAVAGLYGSDACGRFQNVATASQFRRRGLCAYLCHHMARSFLERQPTADLVIVADEGSSAERIYTKIGFVPVSHQWTLTGDRPGADSSRHSRTS